MNRLISIWLCFVLVASSAFVFLPTSDNVQAASILYVGGGDPGNFTTIQDAIDAAASYDTILVYPGVYNENLYVGKSGLQLQGYDVYTTIIDGSGIGYVVELNSILSGISGFTIQNSGSTPGGYEAGIYSRQRSQIIHHNIIKNCHYGILISNIGDFAYDITVHNNTIKDCERYGLFSSERDNNICDNHMYNNAGGGVLIVMNSGTHSIFRNEINNSGRGIALAAGSHNVIRENYLHDNG